MSSEQVTVNQVIVGLLENIPRQIRRATDDATNEQLYYRPSADANSIAWLAWHLSRWQDYMTASISGDLQVWVTGGWAQRFALPPDLPNEATGWGDSTEQVAAFRVDRDMLFGYVEAANRAAVERVSRLTPEQLEQPVLWGTPETPVDTRPAWRALMSVCGEFPSAHWADQLHPRARFRTRLAPSSREYEQLRVTATLLTRKFGEAEQTSSSPP